MNRNLFEMELQMKQRQREIDQAAREAWMFLEKDGRNARVRRGSRINMKFLFCLVMQLIKS